MAVTVAEIRDQAERLKSAIALERYETKAGLKERSALGSVYDDHRLLRSSEALPAIQRELAEATGEERRRLGTLFSWVADQRVEAGLAPFEDELRGWEAEATVRVRDREVRLRQVPAEIAASPVRSERLALGEARNRRLEDAAALRLDLIHREREAVAELGLGSYVEARERLAALNLRGLERQAVRILAHTEDAYREQLAYQLRKRFATGLRDPHRADADWLSGMPWLGERFGATGVLGAVQRDLAELGLPLSANGAVRLDLERRPQKVAGSFTAAIEVPGRVVLVVSPRGGWADARALLHEIGHTLHFAYTSPQLAFEDRALGDTSVTEAFANLFELLTLERTWAERALDLGGGDLDGYLRASAFLALYRLRRHAVLLLYELELASADRPGELTPRYVELLDGATGFAHDPRTYLEDVRRGFWVARQVRAWMLGAMVRASLRDRFDVDWNRNPAAGPFLGEIMSAGQREDAGQIATQLGYERLGVRPLLDRVDEWVS